MLGHQLCHHSKHLLVEGGMLTKHVTIHRQSHAKPIKAFQNCHCSCIGGIDMPSWNKLPQNNIDVLILITSTEKFIYHTYEKQSKRMYPTREISQNGKKSVRVKYGLDNAFLVFAGMTLVRNRPLIKWNRPRWKQNFKNGFYHGVLFMPLLSNQLNAQHKHIQSCMYDLCSNISE